MEGGGGWGGRPQSPLTSPNHLWGLPPHVLNFIPPPNSPKMCNFNKNHEFHEMELVDQSKFHKVVANGCSKVVANGCSKVVDSQLGALSKWRVIGCLP